MTEIDPTKLEDTLRQIDRRLEQHAGQIAAIAAVLASLPETAKLNPDDVKGLALQLSPAGPGSRERAEGISEFLDQILRRAERLQREHQSKA